MTLVSKATAGRVVAAIAVAVGASMSGQGQPAKPARPDYPVQPVPFTRVQLNDVFWAPRIETNRTASIPTAFQQCELTGRMDLFVRAAKALRGEELTNKRPPGYPFDDTDVYKVIEGASYTLNVHPDPKLDAYVDDLIAKIAAAQEPDGYLYTTRTIDPKNPHVWARPERWAGERDDSHELYNLGHLFEAAVAHHMATGKSSLLNVAIRGADLLVKTFGPGKRSIWPGHQITEMGLVRLYRVTGNEQYLSLAKFLLDERGPGPLPPGERTNPRGLSYNQAQAKVIDQAEPVGHSVRATYMYSGMADVAALTGDEKMREAGKRIWENLISSKLYLTGGIGAAGGFEGFGKPYELPNLQAYNETCASIGHDYWNQRLFLLEGDGKYIDVMERTLYNGLVSGVALDGKTFFYDNPLESNGQHSRKAWFGVACCPGNITRFMASVPGYVYAHRGDTLYVNLFAGGTADVDLPGGKLEDRPDDALPVGRRGEDDGHARARAAVRHQRADPRLGAQRAGAEHALSFSRQVHGSGDDRRERTAGADDARQGLRLDRARLEGGGHHRSRPADAGAPDRRERAGRSGPRPRRAAARPDRLRRRMARQPERQGPQHRPAGQLGADLGVPPESSQRRAGDQGHRRGAHDRRRGIDQEGQPAVRGDPLFDVGQSRSGTDGRLARAHGLGRAPDAVIPPSRR